MTRGQTVLHALKLFARKNRIASRRIRPKSRAIIIFSSYLVCSWHRGQQNIAWCLRNYAPSIHSHRNRETSRWKWRAQTGRSGGPTFSNSFGTWGCLPVFGLQTGSIEMSHWAHLWPRRLIWQFHHDQLRSCKSEDSGWKSVYLQRKQKGGIFNFCCN